MKENIYFLILVFLVSCTSKEESYLNKGLTELKNHRVVNEDFIDGFTIKKFGVIKLKEESDYYKLVFLLNGDAKKDNIESYRIGIRCYLDEENRMLNGKTNKKTQSFDFSPIIKSFNNHKYLINSIKTPLRKADSIQFYLYDREDYMGRTYGKRITIKKVKLKII